MSLNGASTPLSASAVSASSPLLKVAVVGAGAAGLATARALDRAGIKAKIFEKDISLGGVWNYHPHSKTRPVYRGLRTNLPREIMAYREFKWGGDGKTVSYVTHGEVRDYLRRYAETYNLERLIQFGCSVRQVSISISIPTEENQKQNRDWPKFTLEWQEEASPEATSTETGTKTEVFDAVCVCNGHYAAPSFPHVPGLAENFHGTIMHSVEYDDPEIFKDKSVLCIGGRASGADLAREISFHAQHVYLSDTTCSEAVTEENVTWVPKTMAVRGDATIQFGDDNGDNDNDNDNHDGNINNAPKDAKVDVIIFCSGYDYQFPFLNENSNIDLSVKEGERRVKPLYEQLWHARYPSLAFVGLQHSVVPFPFFEVQADAVTSQLKLLQNRKIQIAKSATEESSESESLPSSSDSSSSWTLPPLEERLEAAERDADSGGPKGAENGRVQDTHFLGGYQWDAAIQYAKYANDGGGTCSDDDGNGNDNDNAMNIDAVERYIRTNQAIYDHSNLQRKGVFPGGPDAYRYGSYIRDDENESFQRVSMVDQMENVEKKETAI